MARRIVTAQLPCDQYERIKMKYFVQMLQPFCSMVAKLGRSQVKIKQQNLCKETFKMDISHRMTHNNNGKPIIEASKGKANETKLNKMEVNWLRFEKGRRLSDKACHNVKFIKACMTWRRTWIRK